MPIKNRIPLRITAACKKHGINYHSSFLEDTKKIGEILLNLRAFEDELLSIAERHDIDCLRGVLEDDIAKIEVIVHDLSKLANNLQRESYE